MAAVSRRTDPAPPNRPSISPLSTTKSSPIALRDDTMQHSNAEDDENLPEGSDVGATENPELADDQSSSLSEPDDEEDEDARQLLDLKYSRMTTDERIATHSLDIDSEAETERLEQTPSKTRRQAENMGRTPSKLSQAATADDLSDPPSPLPAGPDGASSTSTGGTMGKKRKRSNTADSSLTSAESDLGESPRKRAHESPVDGSSKSAKHANNAADEQLQYEIANAEDDADIDGETPNASHRAGSKGRKSRSKSKSKREAVKEAEPEDVAAENGEDDQEEENAANNADELQHKSAASTLYEDLAKQFASFHEKVYNEKLAALSSELEMLAQPNCKHPEYLRQAACVDARYAKQVSEVQAFYRYKMQALRITTLAERSQLHSQYFQSARELREDVAYQLGEDWYRIQKERRQSNQGQDGQYIVKFSTKRSEQLRNQAKYNQEVSVLSGIAKYVGFPAAPEIAGAEGDALEQDLKAMKIAKRVPQPANPPPLYLANRFPQQQQNERLAHEQFIEQNAWAQPQGPIPNHGTPNLTHTPDWAQPGATATAKHMARTVSTPAFPRREPSADQQPTGTNNQPPGSDPPDRSPVERRAPGLNGGSAFYREPTSPLAVTKQRVGDRDRERELTGFRNFSNISGTSTIDAPDSAEKDKDRAAAISGALSNQPSQPMLASSPTQPHLHHHHQAQPGASRFGAAETNGASAKAASPASATASSTYSHPGSFRPREGAFGTPAPLSATATAATAAAGLGVRKS